MSHLGALPFPYQYEIFSTPPPVGMVQGSAVCVNDTWLGGAWGKWVCAFSDLYAFLKWVTVPKGVLLLHLGVETDIGSGERDMVLTLRQHSARLKGFHPTSVLDSEKEKGIKRKWHTTDTVLKRSSRSKS